MQAGTGTAAISPITAEVNLPSKQKALLIMAPRLTLLMLKLSMALIFASWVSVWVLKPTQLWKRAWHQAEDWASHTFLGANGLNVVVFCFPLLAVATLGYVYLHLRATAGRMRRTARLMTNFSNPVIVDSPVGIVAGGELLAVALFIFFLVWTYYSNVSTDFKKLTPPKPLQLNRWQLKVFRLGVRFGSLTEACLALLLLPVLREMALCRIFGVQFEASVRYHIWLGNGVILFSVLHGTCIMFVWATKKRLSEEITKWQRTGRVNLAGLITLATGLIIWITSLPQIRRKLFQFFYFAHHLYIAFLLFFLFHGGDQHFYLVFSGVLLFALDKILRIIRSRGTTSIVSARILPCRTVELTLPKHPSVKYTPTSMIFVKIPSISKFQWHPFTITSSSNMDADRLTVLVKCQGQWTDSLYDLIHSRQDVETSHLRKIPVAVEGPYGPGILDYHRYDRFLLIAGGSGVTPFLSILQDIASRNCCMDVYPTDVQLIYVVKRSQDLSMLTPVSSMLLNPSAELAHLKLKLLLFVTQEDRSGGTTAREVLLEMCHLKSVVFDANPLVDSLAGPEGLLVKAAITGVSSLIFLSSLLCLSRFFTHEDRRSSRDQTPSWVDDLLVICSFIVALICSIIVISLSRWKRSANRTHEISDTHARASEMQSMKRGQTAEEPEIIFGRRPNLVEILSELPNEAKKSNVGIFVCGPESMKVSLASFCRQYSRKSKEGDQKQKCRFTFHSINFSL